MKVSIGIPVYNGENFLQKAIDSILAQTFKDFEIIICDNASTDNTRDICTSYKDNRIKYHRNATNMGAAWNYNISFQLAKGEYFKWAAHDDVLDPEFLKNCVEALDNNPEAVLSHTDIEFIDEHNQPYDYAYTQPNTASSLTIKRFSNLLLKRHECYQVFGLIRANALRKTNLIGNYTGSDAILLAHLALLGKFIHIPKKLFLNRKHKAQSMELINDPYAYAAWFDPKNKKRTVFPWWRYIGEYYKLLVEFDLGSLPRLQCLAPLFGYTLYRSPYLVKDLFKAMKGKNK